ncbi:glycosyltransferase family 2 protein, partial [Streptomyces sp. B1866]|nr:glycosyltransferase family 2 protein [Streptomyces sp. B1866]
ARFAADVDVAAADRGGPLGPGTWDVLLAVRARGGCRTAPLGQARDAAVDRAAHGGGLRRVVRTGPDGHLRVTPHLTGPHGPLRLYVDRVPHRLDAPCEFLRTAWHPERPDTLVVAGRLHTGFPVPEGALRLRVRDADGATRHEVPVRYEPGGATGEFTAWLCLRDLGPGRWTPTLVLAGPADGRRRATPVPRPAGLPATRWSRRGWRYRAAPLDHPELTLAVTSAGPLGVPEAAAGLWALLLRRLQVTQRQLRASMFTPK